MATPILCQSGDDEWGSGFMLSAKVDTNSTSQAFGDEPGRQKDKRPQTVTMGFSPSPSPSLRYDLQPDECSVHFGSNSAASARRLKAEKEELAHLKAVQRGNKAVVENLEQFVGAELGDQSYQDVIKSNIIGIQEDQKGCVEMVKKAEDDLKKQLEGVSKEDFTGMQKWVQLNV